MIVNLDITDTCCSKCYKNSIEKNVQITSIDTSIELQNNYFLNVLNSNSNITTIMIQNGNYVIIRNLLENVATSILIPSRCSHIITITATNKS